MRELTTRQREVLSFIRAFTTRHGLPPTVREIGDKFSVTPRAAFDHLRALERKGMLQRRIAPGRTARALTLSEAAGRHAPVTAVPILGRIAAGQPLLAEENREGELPIGEGALPGRADELFALRVRGESMIDAHICDGDLVVVRRQDSAQPNDIVVALVESESGDEATVKRFQREGHHVVLKPEHPTMRPIVIDPSEQAVRILGKVVAVLRGF